MNLHPCPACGFDVFQDPPGSYDLCPICDWEDDAVRLRFPSLLGGANATSLREWQTRAIQQTPLDVDEFDGDRQCPDWRPLTPEDGEEISEMPTSGRERFNAVDAVEAIYYWRRR